MFAIRSICLLQQKLPRLSVATTNLRNPCVFVTSEVEQPHHKANSNESNKEFSDELNEKESKSENKENLLKKDIEKLNDMIAELKDKYQRSLAETENVRARLRKEINDAKLFGIQTFCKDLLTVADVMKMAVGSITEEKLTEGDEIWKGLYEGVCMTDRELHKVFERHGLVIVEPRKGDKFDPNEHEALFESPIDGMDPGVIAHVERVGYKLKGRTLRPAQVGVTGKHS